MSLIRAFDDFFEPEFDHLFNSLVSFPSMRRSGSQGQMQTWRPRVDIKETQASVLIHAELPGMTKEDVNVEYNPENNVLTISGETKRETVDDTERVHRSERFFGSFKRSFSVPENVDTQSISAKMEHGVLELVLPKVQAKPSQVSRINIA